MLKEDLAESVKRLEGMLDHLPDAIARDVKAKIAELRKLLLDQRPPRIVLVGRRGSGKSSLINALFGEPVAEVGHEKAQTGAGRWWSYASPTGTLDVLDTRGLQEGSSPTQADSAEGPLQSVLAAIREKTPDVVLFLVKAKEVDAAIDADLALLAELSEDIHRREKFHIPIVGVVTHADEVEPKNVKLHAPTPGDEADHAEKRSRIQRIEGILHKKLHNQLALRDQVVTVLAVSAYQSWRRDGSRRDDERWHIEKLLEFLVAELPTEAKVEIARLSRVKSIQKSTAATITTLVAGLAGAVAAVPIPLADIAPITALQVSLISAVAYLSGRSADSKSAAEFLTAMGLNVGAAFVLREAARALGKWVFPGAGSVVSAAVAWAGTVAVGHAAIAYFIDGASVDDARAAFDSARSRAEADGAPPA